MDEYADIYYVDTRNADSRDHRPGMRPAGVAIGNRIPAGWSTSPALRPTMYPQAQPQVMYAPPPVASTLTSTLFGKLTTGQVVEMVAQLFAALQTLPTAPTATKDVDTDLGNMVLYQTALAQHAKRDEQVRALGGLIAKLVG